MEQMNVSESELIDEDDILGMTVEMTAEGQDEQKKETQGGMEPNYYSRNEASDMETAEDTKQNKKNKECESDENRGNEGRNLRAREKKTTKV